MTINSEQYRANVPQRRSRCTLASGERSPETKGSVKRDYLLIPPCLNRNLHVGLTTLVRLATVVKAQDTLCSPEQPPAHSRRSLLAENLPTMVACLQSVLEVPQSLAGCAATVHDDLMHMTT